MQLNKKVLIRIIMLVLIVGLVGFLASKVLSSDNGDTDAIEVIYLDSDTKIKTGDHIVLMNALYQKAQETTKALHQSTADFNQGAISSTELKNVITKSNKQLTYYYLVAIQNQPSSVTEELGVDMEYEFYLMRRGSEELLKYVQDSSSLRLSVGSDLLAQAIKNEPKRNEEMATELVRYAVNPNEVVISTEVWDKEYTFIQDQPDMVIFRDIEETEKDSYSYYLRFVNDAFMLVSWEIQNMYLAKVDYTQDEITQEHLKSKLDGSGFIINQVYDDLELVKAPEGLGQLDEDTRKTMTLYRDAMLEMQKFRMSGDTKHFDNAMIIINQADVEAGRIGEFIYAVRQQYGL